MDSQSLEVSKALFCIRDFWGWRRCFGYPFQRMEADVLRLMDLLAQLAEGMTRATRHPRA